MVWDGQLASRDTDPSFDLLHVNKEVNTQTVSLHFLALCGRFSFGALELMSALFSFLV